MKDARRTNMRPSVLSEPSASTEGGGDAGGGGGGGGNVAFAGGGGGGSAVCGPARCFRILQKVIKVDMRKLIRFP